MRRALRVALFFLLLGTAVNVAVAWGCAWLSPGVWMQSPVRDSTEIPACYPVDSPQVWRRDCPVPGEARRGRLQRPNPRGGIYRVQDPIGLQAEAAIVLIHTTPAGNYIDHDWEHVQRYRAGWPLASLCWTERSDGSVRAGGIVAQVERSSGLAVWSPGRQFSAA